MLYTCFAPLVFFWARRYGRSSSWLREEEYPVLVNQAFAKFAVGMSHHTLSDFATIGQRLTYLKRCVFSVVADEVKAARSHLLHDPLEPYDTLLAPDDMEAETLSALSASALWQRVLAVVSREEERVVLTATYQEGSTPRDIQRRYPQLFPTVNQVYQVQQRVRTRLRRNRTLRDYRRQMEA